MFTVIDSAFDSTILFQPGVYAPARTARVRRRRAAVAVPPPMPASLWRHSLRDGSEGRVHRWCVRTFCAGTALLSLGSVGYAAWHLSALVGGQRLHDAVAAFAR